MAEEIVTIFKAETKQYEQAVKAAAEGVKKLAEEEEKAINAHKTAAKEAEGTAQKRIKFIKEETEDLAELKRMRDAAHSPEEIDEYNKRIAETEKRIKTVKDVTVEATTFAERFGIVGKKAFEFLDHATFGLLSKFKGVIGAIGGMTKGMGALKAAIVSTGIGALVVALGSLVTYFTATEQGARKLHDTMAGAKAGVKVLTDRFAMLGESLLALAFGQVSVAAEKFQHSMEGIGHEIAKETKLAYQLSHALHDQMLAEVELIETQASRSRSLAEFRLRAEDETLSIQERTQALNTAFVVQEIIAQKEIKLLQAKLETQRKLNEQSKTDEEADRKAEAEIIAQIENARTEAFLRQKALQTRKNELTKRGVAQEEQAAERARQIAEQELQAKQEAFNLAAAMIDESANKELVNLDLLLARKVISQEDYLQAVIAMEERRAQRVGDLYGKDSIEYKQALLDKLNAQKTYSDAVEQEIHEIAEFYINQTARELEATEKAKKKEADEWKELQDIIDGLHAQNDEDDKEASEKKKAQDQAAFDNAIGLSVELSSILQQQSQENLNRIQQEGDANDRLYQNNIDHLRDELQVAEGADRKRILSAIGAERRMQQLNQETTQKNLEEERKRMKNYKRAQLVATTIAEAVALGRAFSDLGPIGGPIAAVALALKFAFLLAQIESQEFAEGTDYVLPANSKQGKKVDDIPAMLTKGEAVIPVNENTKHRGLVKSLLNGNVDDFINRHYVIPKIQQELMEKANGQRSAIMTAMLNDANIVNMARRQIDVQKQGTRAIVSAIQSTRKHSRDVA